MILTVFFNFYPHYVAHNLVDPTPPFNLLTPLQPSCHHPCRGSSCLPSPRLRLPVLRRAGWLQVNTQSVLLNPAPCPLSPAHWYISSQCHAYNVICTLSSRHHPCRGSICPSPAYSLSPGTELSGACYIFNCIRYTAYSIQLNSYKYNGHSLIHVLNVPNQHHTPVPSAYFQLYHTYAPAAAATYTTTTLLPLLLSLLLRVGSV